MSPNATRLRFRPSDSRFGAIVFLANATAGRMRNLQFSTRKKLRISLLKFLPWFHKMKENGHEEFQRQPVNMKHKQASPYRPVNIPHFAESFLIVSSRQAENIRYVSSFNICINKKKEISEPATAAGGKTNSPARPHPQQCN
jgi:hypothetical protein